MKSVKNHLFVFGPSVFTILFYLLVFVFIWKATLWDNLLKTTYQTQWSVKIMLFTFVLYFSLGALIFFIASAKQQSRLFAVIDLLVMTGPAFFALLVIFGQYWGLFSNYFQMASFFFSNLNLVLPISSVLLICGILRFIRQISSFRRIT